MSPNFVSSPTIGNLLILVAAFIGVGGSYYLYKRRQADRREKIKNALQAEISQTSYLGGLVDAWENDGINPRVDPIPPDQLPNPDFIPTVVYEELASDLGLLEANEVQRIVEYYSILIYIKGLIDTIRTETPESTKPGEALAALLKKYDPMRDDLIKMLEGKIEPNEVKTADVYRTMDGEIEVSNPN